MYGLSIRRALDLMGDSDGEGGALIQRAKEELATLTKERDEARQRAAEEEYRGRDWMVRCEDAEAEVERLKKERDLLAGERDGLKAVALSLRDERDEARVEVVRLTRERDAARADAMSIAETAEESEQARIEAERDTQRWRDAVARNAARLDELKAWDPMRLPSPTDAVVEEVLFGGTDDMEAPEMIPSAHAEKVLVAVAKSAAQVGAEDMRSRAVQVAQRYADMWREFSKTSTAEDWKMKWGHAGLVGQDPVEEIRRLEAMGDEP